MYNPENPNRLLTTKNVKNAYNLSYHKSISDILNKPVKKKEKLMKKNIAKVLNLLYKYGRLNTIQLHNYGINWDSLTKVLSLLRKKKIILLRQFHNKQNNEKIYQIRKIRAIVYLDHIFNYDKNIGSHNKLVAYSNSYNKFLDKVPQDFLSWRIFATPKLRKSLSIERNGCLIGNLPSEKTIQILDRYNYENFCINCQNEKKKKLGKQRRKFLFLTEMMFNENRIQCMKCGSEQVLFNF